MVAFDVAYNKTIGHEGCYVPPTSTTDLGGETWIGISRIYWSSWIGWSIIDSTKLKVLGSKPSYTTSNITKLVSELNKNTELDRLVRLFYKDNFWTKYKLQYLPDEVAIKLFDTIVNLGGSSTKYLQLALNLLNLDESLYPDLVVDGIFGNATNNAMTKYLSSRSNFTNSAKLTVLLKIVNTYQGMHYIDLAVKTSNTKKSTKSSMKSQEYNIFGWFNARIGF